MLGVVAEQCDWFAQGLPGFHGGTAVEGGS